MSKRKRSENHHITGDYHKDIAIDKNDLENEWIIHPSKVMAYAEEYVEALAYKDELKRKLEHVGSTLYLDIRQNPSKYGFDSKPSEGAIKAKIDVTPKHIKALKKYNKANKEYNMMFEAKKSFEHRKAGLSGAVSVRITGMHSEPKNDIRGLKQQESIAQNKDIKKNLGKRRKKKKKKSS